MGNSEQEDLESVQADQRGAMTVQRRSLCDAGLIRRAPLWNTVGVYSSDLNSG